MPELSEPEPAAEQVTVVEVGEPPFEDDCGCSERRAWLNGKVPGLGDTVAHFADPIQERWKVMPDLLRPDMKSLVWLAIGAFVVPMVLRKF